MKSDARVRYTLKVIGENLLELMKDKPLNKITVKELCERAEINRATFYTHFSDCYTALEYIETDLVDQFREALEPGKSLDFKATTENFFDIIKNNYELCQIIIFSQRDIGIINKMVDIAHDTVIEFWKEKLSGATELEVEMLFISVATGMANIFIKGYEKYDHADLLNFIVSFTENSVNQYM